MASSARASSEAVADGKPPHAPEFAVLALPNVLGVVLLVLQLAQAANAAGASDTLNCVVLFGVIALSAYYNVLPATAGPGVDAAGGAVLVEKRSVPPLVPARSVAFLGLGRMGRRMALNLAKHEGVALQVWNRSEGTAAELEAEAEAAGGAVKGFSSAREAAHGCDVVFLCLPTTQVVAQVCDAVGDGFKPGAVVVDCTSGEPEGSRVVAAALADKGFAYVDAPVSGGPAGAANATLTMMVGAADDATFAKVKPVLDVVGKKVVRVGGVGCGHAVKAVNNSLMAAALLASAEGLCALASAGVAPETALAVINASSGRNLATQERIPKYVLSRKFDFGFALGLLLKDNGIAADMLDDSLKGGYIDLGAAFLNAASEKYGADVDFTNAARLFEEKAGVQLEQAN